MLFSGRRIVVVTLSLLSAAFTPLASADEVLVAVAANFTAPMKDIAQAFQQKTGHTLKLSFGSSGKFVAQIENGAPFEVFLSADQSKPQALIQSGRADGNTRFTYALGGLVLWSPEADADVHQQLLDGSFERLALANPRLAPYGEAALQTLAALNLSDATQNKQVMGENISQTWQFVSSGNAQLGFVALSQVMADGKIQNGSSWVVPQNLYQPIRQDAVLLKRGAGNQAARDLLAYLKSADVSAIIARYGYGR
ncbi:molybdate ABC transporter substrate-binding protein [Thalassolituus sp. LLYu03]|uniref:molybdate ABC transporter substrate-binding protein n=1 Tax=Thalassolituus sp. LLYu03 TaxID=3421656 RepID=UPI003D2671BB